MIWRYLAPIWQDACLPLSGRMAQTQVALGLRASLDAHELVRQHRKGRGQNTPAHQLASDEHLDVGSLNAQLTRFDEID